MPVNFITYRSGYEYQLAADYSIQTNIRPAKDIITTFVKLNKAGVLTTLEGYAWDGASGIPDTNYNLRASLFHDALYQLMRLKHLDTEKERDNADLLFKEICIKDGVSSVLANWYYIGLREFGEPAADPKNKKKIKRVP